MEHDAVPEELHRLSPVVARGPLHDARQRGRELGGRLVARLLGQEGVAAHVQERDRGRLAVARRVVAGLLHGRLEDLDRLLEDVVLQVTVVQRRPQLLGSLTHSLGDRPDRLEHVGPPHPALAQPFDDVRAEKANLRVSHLPQRFAEEAAGRDDHVRVEAEPFDELAATLQHLRVVGAYALVRAGDRERPVRIEGLDRLHRETRLGRRLCKRLVEKRRGRLRKDLADEAERVPALFDETRHVVERHADLEHRERDPHAVQVDRVEEAVVAGRDDPPAGEAVDHVVRRPRLARELRCGQAIHDARAL